MNKKHIILILVGIVIVGLTSLIVMSKNTTSQNSNNNKTTSSSKSTSSASTKPAGFNKSHFSISDPNSQWVVVNKIRPLQPLSYMPANLVVPNIPLRSNITSDEKYVRNETATALQKMAAAASAQGLTLNLQSGYRSYPFQNSLYNSYVKSQGQVAADRSSARPGYSEHQTGWSADLGGITSPGCNVDQCFATTPEGTWLAAHAYEYGFIIRYPDGKEAVTGYEYEPWHIRYVGIELSTVMHNAGIQTLEEFFGLPPAPTY